MRLLNYLCLLLLKEVDSQPDVPVVCGGYVKAVFRADFSKIKVKLYLLHLLAIVHMSRLLVDMHLHTSQH